MTTRSPDRCSFCHGIGNHAPSFDCRPQNDSNPARHILKTWPAPFEALSLGVKTFEFRKDDRGFRVGDMLVLREWVPKEDHPDGGYETGNELIRWVTYLLRGPAFGLPDGFVVMSVSAERPKEIA